MGYKYKDEILQGELPEHGAIFMSNKGTKKECFRRKLFGLPSNMSDFVLHVKKGMMLFLFEFERRLLYGVFRATSDGDINIEPRAYRSTGKNFPAQVHFTTIMECNPLEEHEFHDAIRDNYFSGKKFNFGLNKKQVNKLMELFRSKQISKNHPERNLSRHDDKSAERDARFGDLRKDIRSRLRFVGENDDDLEANHENSNEKFVEEIKNDFNYGRTKNDINDRYLPSYNDDDFGDCDSNTRLEILGKNINHSLEELRRVNDEHEMHNNFSGINNKDKLLMRENIKHDDVIEDGYIPIFTESHFDETGQPKSQSHFDDRMEIRDKDIMDYNRLRDEYNIRKDFRQSLSSTHETLNDPYFFGLPVLESENRMGPTIPFSDFNQTAYSTSCNPSYFYDESSFIPLESTSFYPISNESNHTLFPIIKSPQYHSQNEAPTPYFDDHVYGPLTESQHMFSPYETRDVLEGSQSSVFPKFIPRNISYVDSGQRAHENDPIDIDRRLCKPRESEHRFGSDKRVSVFSRLKSSLKREKESENDKKPELGESVDKVMNMLEKVVNSPIKRGGKSKSGSKQDDYDDKIRVSKIVDYEVTDMEVDDADLAIEDGSLVQETRLVDFKRRKKVNNSVASATSDMGSACKRRKLVRPAFVEKKLVGGGVSAAIDTDMLQNVCNDDVIKSVEINKFLDVKNSDEKIDESDSTKAAVEKKFVDDGVSVTLDTYMLQNSCENTCNDDVIKFVDVKNYDESDSTKAVEKKFVDDGVSATLDTDMLQNYCENACNDDVIKSVEINKFVDINENPALKDESDSTKAVEKGENACSDDIIMSVEVNKFVYIIENSALKDESDSTKTVEKGENACNDDVIKSVEIKEFVDINENSALKDESDSTKAVEGGENACDDDVIKSVKINEFVNLNENPALKDESDSTKEAVEKGDESTRNLDLNMVPEDSNDAYSCESVQLDAEFQKSGQEQQSHPHVEDKDGKISAKEVLENSDEFQKNGQELENQSHVEDKDDKNSAKLVLENSDEFQKSGQELENQSHVEDKDDKNSAKEVLENSDEFQKSGQELENQSHVEDNNDKNSAKQVLENSDEFQKSGQELENHPHVENADDKNSAKEVLQNSEKCQKSGQEQENHSPVENSGDKSSAKEVLGNSEKCQKSGNEGLQVEGEKKSSEKMCGWIEW